MLVKGGDNMPDTFKRYEKKYIISKNQQEHLLSLLDGQIELEDFCKKNGSYLIRNVYLDSIDDTLIRRSCDKPKFKEKIRIRKYGTYNDGKDQYFLEMKRKCEGVVYKRRVKLSRLELHQFTTKGIIPEGKNYLERQVLNELSYFFKLYEPIPKTFISYERIAYQGIYDKEFRLTFDSNITSRRNDFNFDNDEKELDLLNSNSSLMEVKVAGAMPLWFTKALSEINIAPTSFSKYGMEFKLTVKGNKNLCLQQ